MHLEPLNQLHSIRFRKPGFKSKAVLSPEQEKKFTRFLINALGPDVFVISTGLGLDVYYTHEKDCSEFIIKNLWLFQNLEEQPENAILTEINQGRDVLNYFGTVVNTLVAYPLLFVSCCKKFMFQYHITQHKTRLHLLLYSAFEFHLHDLITDGKIPYLDTIKKLLKEANNLDYSKMEDREKWIVQFKKSQNLN